MFNVLKIAEDTAMIEIEQFDHFGIRVTDKARALAFYSRLGFALEHESDFDAVVIIKNPSGVELNLIVNGVDLTGGKNILMTFGDGHVSVFIRDPDRNVIELRARLDPQSAEKIEGLVFYDPKG